MNTQFLARFVKPFFLTTALVLTLASLFFAVLIKKPVHAENQRIVTIYHDGQQQVVATDAKTVDEVLHRANITLNQSDTVEPTKEVELIAANYTVNVYRARPVTVIDGTQRYRIMSPYQSAKKIAEAAGLQTYPEDQFSLTRIDDFVTDNGMGLKLTIKRSTPFAIVLYGQKIDMRTQAKTIGELLKEKNIVLGKDDGISPSADMPITAGMTVDVYRNGVQTINQEQVVPFAVKQIQDADQDIGYKQVQTPGVAGKKVVTFEMELKNGKEVSRKEIQSVITVQPKEQVEIVGVKRKSFSGGLDQAFAQLRQCEAGGNYARNSGNGYYGAYQYNNGTWGNYGGYARADLAPPAVQDQKAYETYQSRGWAPWPACSRTLGL